MAGMSGRLTRSVALAALGLSLYAAAPLVVGVSPAQAQTRTLPRFVSPTAGPNIPPSPAPNASAEQKAIWARQAVVTLTLYYGSRPTEGAQFSEAVQNLLLSNPSLAGQLTDVIVNLGDRSFSAPGADGAGGEGEVFVNPSMSIGLAKGLAYAVATWQAQVNANPGASPVAQAALTAVNTAFAAAQVSPGGIFARTFAAASVSTGSGLVSPALVDPNSPEAVLQVTVLPPEKTTSNNVPSPNTVNFSSVLIGSQFTPGETVTINITGENPSGASLQ
ncbi:MAG: hypothetical protein DI549_05250 [Ancylobacter novellus]|uniref:Uncharacterized protein n=1 Tax=Ancylobacter novellus TaxID=921 RepID=A0A2W5R5L4_ANCNO|nr:MAG: hypothetical protein DI549_05250 [Ancylobacter novellus]